MAMWWQSGCEGYVGGEAGVRQEIEVCRPQSVGRNCQAIQHRAQPITPSHLPLASSLRYFEYHHSSGVRGRSYDPDCRDFVDVEKRGDL